MNSSLFFFLLGWVYGFRFKRQPKLSPQSWTDALNNVGQQSIRDVTHCYAFDANPRSSVPSIIGTGSATNGRGIVSLTGETMDGGALFLFDRTNNNPTQRDVDAYFHSKPDPSPQEVVEILLRTVTWKKKKKIDVLSGDNLLIVMSSLRRLMSAFSSAQLRYATIGILDILQVVPLVGIESSGM